MKLKIGEYLIESDSNQFKLLQVKTVQKSEDESKIGEEYTTPIGNYSSIDSLLRAIPTQIMLEYDDIKTIVKELKTIKVQIAAIRKALEEVVKE